MAFKKSMVTKEDVIQAVLIADNFDDEFVPISNDIPLVSVNNIAIKILLIKKYFSRLYLLEIDQ